MKTLFRLLLVCVPWKIRRHLLQRLFGYELHPSSWIGWAWVFPKQLVMAQGARIGHLTVCKGLDRLSLGESASIGRLNWITAYPTAATGHFAHLRGRQPALDLAEHAAMTNRHIVDCTEHVAIGRFATVAGFRSQILTHSIDLALSRQHAKPVIIGDYCFVGTACTILGGASLPHHSVLGANALLNKAFTQPFQLYAGVPAVPVAPLDAEMKYFSRPAGFVT